MRKPNDISLKDAIGKMLDTYRLRRKFDETSVVSLWPDIVGIAVSNRTRQIYIHNKRLFVRIESSVIKNELLLVRRGIIEKINERVGSDVVEELVFL